MTALDVHIRRKVYGGATGVGRHVAIDGLRFHARSQEFLCILGPSGCGKTTLLNLIAGLDRNFDGHIHIPADRRFAYVFQTPRLLPWRTVLANVTLATGDSAAHVARAKSLLDEVGLGAFIHAYPGQLSLGMQRRAALARAYAVDPALLLMDEPFVSLDEPTGERLRDLLFDLWQTRPATILFVTHNSREAIRLGQRLLILSSGPARVLREIPVPLTDRERRDPQAIEAFRRERLADVKNGCFFHESQGNSGDDAPASPPSPQQVQDCR